MDPLFQRLQRILRGKRKRGRRARLPPLDEAPEPPLPAAEPTDALAQARATLEVAPDADAEAIRQAYRRLCRRYHPDRFADDRRKQSIANELLARINRAYEQLGGR